MISSVQCSRKRRGEAGAERQGELAEVFARDSHCQKGRFNEDFLSLVVQDSDERRPRGEKNLHEARMSRILAAAANAVAHTRICQHLKRAVARTAFRNEAPGLRRGANLEGGKNQLADSSRVPLIRLTDQAHGTQYA